MLDLFNEAVLLVDTPEKGLQRGDVGVVVEIYNDHEGYEVEFMTEKGRTIAVETLMADQVRPRIGSNDLQTVGDVIELNTENKPDQPRYTNEQNVFSFIKLDASTTETEFVEAASFDDSYSNYNEPAKDLLDKLILSRV